jgi:hypothetical protein
VRLYILKEGGSYVIEKTPNGIFADTHVCYVRAGDWYEARARALAHAEALGVDTIGILAGTCELYCRPHWNGKGPQTHHARASAYQLNGMWLYLQRLARRFAHAYVPPLGALRTWESLQKYPWIYECNPVPARCAVYRVGAVLQSVRGDKSGPWGQALCSHGYDSLTVSDYYHHNLGGNVLDESGSAKTWKKAYEHQIHRHL